MASKEKTPELSAEQFQALLEHSQQQAAQGGKDFKFSTDETKKFKTAFEDPEFRRMFTEYIDEMQDPKNRAENEAYITQLEGEKKVPEGKELIRPSAAFVAKAKKKMLNNGQIDKMFLNIVQSDRIAKPSKKSVDKGEHWSLPSVLGPPHMEKDKTDSNATAFDCCFHPDCIAIANKNERFRDLLVQTALDLVLEFYKRANQKVEILKMEKGKDDGKKKADSGASDMFHILQGVAYKNGSPPTMLVAIESLDIHNKTDTAELKSGTKAVVSDSKFSQGGNIAVANSVPKGAKTPAASSSSFTSSSSSSSSSSDKSVIETENSGPIRDHSGDLKPVASKTTVVKRGFLNSGPQNGSNGLIQELKSVNFDSKSIPSSAKSSASGSVGSSNSNSKGTTIEDIHAALVGNKHNNSDSSSSSGSSRTETEPQATGKVPVYTMIERTATDMGDFNNNKSVKSSRPTEIVIKFQLPLVKKASEVVLDVAIKSVKLQYQDIYDCMIHLSYPVYDLKGSAKYDKASKTLTVTIPVVPFTQETEIFTPSGEATSLDATVDANAKVEDCVVVDKATGQGKSEMVKEVASKPMTSSLSSDEVSPAHSNSNNNVAVEKSNSLSSSNPLSNPTLKERIAAEALLAKEKYEEDQRVKAAAPPPAPPQALSSASTSPPSSPPPSPSINAQTKPESTIAPSAASSSNDISDSDALPFISSSRFEERKVGYYFGSGKEGLGYYKDLKDNHWTSVAKPKVSIPSLTAAESKTDSANLVVMPLPKFQSRSLKDCTTVLIQVSNVVPLSIYIEVDIRARMIHVLFRELWSKNISNSDHYNNYALTLKLSDAGFDGKVTYDVSSNNIAIIVDKASSADKVDVTMIAYSGQRSFSEYTTSAIPLQKSPPVLINSSTPTAAVAVEAAAVVQSSSPSKSPSKETQKLQEMMAKMSFTTSSAALDLD